MGPSLIRITISSLFGRRRAQSTFFTCSTLVDSRSQKSPAPASPLPSTQSRTEHPPAVLTRLNVLMEALDAARRRYPAGDQADATVIYLPESGVIEIFIELDHGHQASSTWSICCRSRNRGRRSRSFSGPRCGSIAPRTARYGALRTSMSKTGDIRASAARASSVRDCGGSGPFRQKATELAGTTGQKPCGYGLPEPPRLIRSERATSCRR